MREIVELRSEEVVAANFLDDDLVEIAPKILVVGSLGQKLSEGLDRDERVADFVRNARREIGPKSGAIHQFLFLPERFLGRQVLDNGDRA